MGSNGLNTFFSISFQCGLLITFLVLNGTIPRVGHAQENVFPLTAIQARKAGIFKENTFPPLSNNVVCSQMQKRNCQSHPLSAELVERDNVLDETISPYSLVRTSFSQPQKEFLTLEIYVDQDHRNFQDEIIEIFDQSLELQTWQEGTSIGLECHCDDREPMAYSFILGHLWGKRAKAYLQNLAVHTARVELLNYGKEHGICRRHSGECQDGSRLQAAFRFLAIGEPPVGCLIQLRLSTKRNHRQVLFEEHPLFLQEIHVAGAWARRLP